LKYLEIVKNDILSDINPERMTE